MNLKKLTIEFMDIDELFDKVNISIEVKEGFTDIEDVLSFDSLETYRSFMTSGKMDIISAISKLKPGSIYKLAEYLGRRPQHVTTDCRSLESFGFIKLIESKEGRKSLRPELIFDYDVIIIENDKVNPILVSSRSENVLQKALAAS